MRDDRAKAVDVVEAMRCRNGGAGGVVEGGSLGTSGVVLEEASGEVEIEALTRGVRQRLRAQRASERGSSGCGSQKGGTGDVQGQG